MFWTLSENVTIKINAPAFIIQLLSENILLSEKPPLNANNLITLNWNQQLYLQYFEKYWNPKYNSEDNIYSEGDDGFFLVCKGFFLNYSKHTNKAAFYIEKAFAADYLTFSYPLLKLLIYLLDLRGFVPLHAAVIGNNNGFVLIPGKQNSGKSTTSASWVLNGGKLLTDDTCFVNPLHPNKIYGYYPSIRLREQSLNILRNQLSADQLKQKDSSKYFYQVLKQFPENFAPVGFIKAVFCIQIKNGPPSHIVSDAQTAYKHLASSLAFSIHHGASGKLCLQAIKIITSSLPVYLIYLSPYPKVNYEYLETLMNTIPPINSSIS
jgi:hypothetical protein